MSVTYCPYCGEDSVVLVEHIYTRHRRCMNCDYNACEEFCRPLKMVSHAYFEGKPKR